MIAQEILIITEHQEQIRSPKHHIDLHKRHDARMARHRVRYDRLAFAAEAHFLNPRNEKTAIARTENVHHHHHHPEAERS